jgi:hypothetical protein
MVESDPGLRVTTVTEHVTLTARTRPSEGGTGDETSGWLDRGTAIMRRILIGGIAAGVVVFAWGAISHMLLPTGEMGIKRIPNEETVLGTLKDSIREPGLYFFPGMDMSRKPTPEEEKAWTERYQAGPTGILVYNPAGGSPLSPRQLLTELASNIAAALLAAWIVSQVSGGYGRRAILVMGMGLFAWLCLSVSYWNWYGFPAATTLSEAIDQVGGWLFGGLILAAIVKPPPK